MESIVIALVGLFVSTSISQSVSLSVSLFLDILETARSLVFSKILHEVRAP